MKNNAYREDSLLHETVAVRVRGDFISVWREGGEGGVGRRKILINGKVEAANTGAEIVT